MRAKIDWHLGKLDGEEVEGQSLREIQSKLRNMLDVSGPRGLRARTADGQVIVASLYDGESYITDRSGRTSH